MTDSADRFAAAIGIDRFLQNAIDVAASYDVESLRRGERRQQEQQRYQTTHHRHILSAEG